MTMAKGKILVVDDDRLVLATVTHGLAKAGYEIIDADNGDDAILLARQHRPDLALLDIRMEGMSGFDVAAYLRESLQTPFMFLSAFADVENALVATARLAERETLQAEAARRSRETLRLAEVRYREGADDLLSVLDAQRSLFNAEDQQAQARLERLQAAVALYKALGGGWQQPQS